MMRAFTSGRFLRFFYAQEQPKNVFKLPRRFDLTTEAYSEVQVSIHSATSCKILATILRDNISLVTDLHIAHIYGQLRKYNLTIDDSFYSIVIPISLEYINSFTREQSEILYEMAMTALMMNVESQVFWSAMFKKLDDQNIFRYIPLMKTALLLTELLDHPVYKDHSLTKKLLTVVHQQKQFYLSSGQARKLVRQIVEKSKNLTTTYPQLSQAYKQIV